MCVQFRAPEIAAFHDTKRAFDPDGILNPGKAVPALEALRRVGRHARARRAGATRRHPAILMDSFIDDLCERIRDHAARSAPLRIRGGGSKDFYGEQTLGESARDFGLLRHRRVRAEGAGAHRCARERGSPRSSASLHPSARCCRSSRRISATPRRSAAQVAAGLSGPRRPYAGAVRDFVLGTRIVNGKGEDLSFGGRVIKNVAGYDISRLMAGSLGTLGVITEISFKVLPRPVTEATLAFEMDEAGATEQVNRWAGMPLPLSGTAWEAGRLRVRLSGAETAVAAAKAKMGGEAIDAGDYWYQLREQRLPFFSGDRPLWRVSVPQASEPMALPYAPLVEWGGGLRWLSGEVDPLTVRSTAERAGGTRRSFAAEIAASASSIRSRRRSRRSTSASRKHSIRPAS
jgi:glycolate oxidase FAD binding subunit